MPPEPPLEFEPPEPPDPEDPDPVDPDELEPLAPPDFVPAEREAVVLEVVALEPVARDLVPVVDRDPVDFAVPVDLVRPPALAVLAAPVLAREAVVPVDFDAEPPADLVRDLVPLAAALVPVPDFERVEPFLAPPVLVLLRPPEEEEEEERPLPPPPPLPVLPLPPLLERVEPPISLRTASVAAVTIAAPILLALSVAVSAAS